MAPQNDLTAERAAALYDSLNAYIPTDRCVHKGEFDQVEIEKLEDIARLTAALKTARQDALREARQAISKLFDENTSGTPEYYCALLDAGNALDRLASEGG